MTASITHLNEYRAGRAKMVPPKSLINITVTLQTPDGKMLELPGTMMTSLNTEDSLQEGHARWSRHTADIDQAPEKVSKGVIWAWVAMGALLAVYCVWLWRMK
jgi:hypothetical protein